MATADSTRPGPGGAEEPVTVEELYDDDTGRWQITTQTSIYLLDLDQRTVLRIPGAAGEHGINPDTQTAYAVTALEDDRHPQPLHLVIQCRLGQPMYLYTNTDATGTTLRGSTPLREIRSLEPRESKP